MIQQIMVMGNQAFCIDGVEILDIYSKVRLLIWR